MTDVAQPVLPATLIGRIDLARLVREVETVDNDFEEQKVREHATTELRMPNLSRSLGDFLQLNGIDVTDPQARMDLKNKLRFMKDKSPIIHMTFAVEPDSEFLERLVGWIRQEIHPAALLSVGLQPAIIGGVMMRTPNHIHDYTVRTMLGTKRGLIRQELETLNKQAAAALAQAQAVAPAEAQAKEPAIAKA